MTASDPRRRASPDSKVAGAPVAERDRTGTRIVGVMPSPDLCQRQRDEHGNEEQHADHHERQANVILPIKQYPGRQREPGHEFRSRRHRPSDGVDRIQVCCGRLVPWTSAPLPFVSGFGQPARRACARCRLCRQGKNGRPDRAVSLNKVQEPGRTGCDMSFLWPAAASTSGKFRLPKPDGGRILLPHKNREVAS